MLKKLLMSAICLLGSISVVYMCFHNDIINILNAQSAPTFRLQKGQKVVLGKYNNNELVWDVGNNANDYVLMTSKPLVDEIAIYNDSIVSSCITNSNAGGILTTTYCPSTLLDQEIAHIIITTLEASVSLKLPHLPSVSDVKTGGSYGLTLQDRAFAGASAGSFEAREWYWLDGIMESSSFSTFQNMYQGNAFQTGLSMSGINMSSGVFTDAVDGAVIDCNQELIVSSNGGVKGVKRSLRPFAVLDRNKVNFAANTSFTDGNWHEYVINTDNFNKVNELNPVKLRVESSLTASLLDIKRNNHSTQQIVKNQNVILSVNANTGNNTKMSIILFNESADEIKYYKLGSSTQNGTTDYSLDLTGIPVGKYQVAVINEEYDASSQLAVESSPISDLLPLEIVEPHKITYTKTPQNGATTGIDYEFSKNVDAGQTVGKITVNPQGVMPLTYSVDSNGDNTYQNFEIDGLSGSTSSSSSLNVKIKSGAPDLVNGGLKAGTYKFCVNVVDANGDPVNATSDNRVCTSFTVEKTHPSVTFDDPNQTKKSISEAANSWNETATVTPSSGVKIIYSITGGYANLIQIDSDSGHVTYNGNNAFNRVTIRATADDDPSIGYNNYEEAYVEKEIVIYREVNAELIPDSASSDHNIPTFTTEQTNVKSNGVIGKVLGREGTPDTIGGSLTTYNYTLENGQDSGMFQVSANGTITVKSGTELGVGSYHFTVKVTDNWSTKVIPVTINVGIAAAEDLKFYENSTSNTAISSKSVIATDTNVSVYATVRGSSNPNPVNYRIEDGSTNVIEVNPSSGTITIHGVGTVTIVAEKQGAAGQANATARLTFTVTAGTQNFIYTDSAGNELPKTNDQYQVKEEIYQRSGTFQLYTGGNPPGSIVTYQLKNNSPTDVISVDHNGLVHILNASLNNQMGNVIVQATSHDPTGNYSDKTIELPINIKKANHTISFAGVTYAINGSGIVSPVINEQDISSNDGGVQVNDTDYYITIDSSISTSVAWTNNGVDIEYNYSGNGIDIPLHVEKAGNRNYNRAEAAGTMHIMGPDENTLAINRPGRIIYGDHFEIKSLQDDSSSTNVQYVFEVDNTTYISNPTVNGNRAEFDALKYSGSTNITISVTRTADGETPLSKTVTVQVLPKPIEINIDDKEKYKGEQNPTLTYQDIRSHLVSWNGIQDVIQEHDIQLNTAANTNSNAGNYPIKGNTTILNRTYPNYSFTFREGTLTVTEENIEDDWYHLEIDDGNNTAYTGNWTNRNIKIISDHNEYSNLSLDQSTWDLNQATVTKEGETNQSFWMKKDSGAITSEKQEMIRIDKTAPKVKNIKAKDTNNQLQDLIHQLSNGIFFKPGTAFEITTDDSKNNLKVSGTKEIAYKVYKVEQQARSTDELIKEGTLTVINEKALITTSDTVGKYKVCVTPTDNAGNTNSESCHEITLKKIDVDVDEDGKPDFNDPNGDGCPDLNIKWKDPNDETKWIVINGDRDNDGIPDLNIDSNGDGKADLNIDTDNDSKPDLNLVILKKTDWKPTKCVKADVDNGILEEYCTGTSVQAVINVDTDNDGIPEINIDNKGDFKPHLNISKDGKIATVNIADVHEWKPNKNYTSGKFTYDSNSEEYQPQTNIDTDQDGRPDINLDFDNDGVPDINIDTDGDNIPDINIDSTGDGKADINVDTDDDGNPDENIKEITEWKPDKNIDGELPYDTMDFNEPQEPDKPLEPSDPTDPDDTSKPTQQGNKTDVKGAYYPGNNEEAVASIGGALTGDETEFMFYLCSMFFVIGIITFLLYKYYSYSN